MSVPSPDNQFDIRLARPHDVQNVMALVRGVVPRMLQEGNLQWDESYPNERIFRSDISRNQLWLAEVSDTIAGLAAITTDPEPEYAQAGLNVNEPAVVVHRLAVDVSFRGAGIARTLMHHAEQIAAERGIPTMRVDTNIQNEAAQRFFLKLNYRLAGEISLNIRPGLRVVCYEKRIRLP